MIEGTTVEQDSPDYAPNPDLEHEAQVEQIVSQIRGACDLSATYLKSLGYTLTYTITKSE